MRAIHGFLCGTPILTRDGFITQEERLPASPLFCLAGNVWRDSNQPVTDWFWGDGLIWLKLSNGYSLKIGRAQLILLRFGGCATADLLAPGTVLMNSTDSDPYPVVQEQINMPVTGRLFAYRHMPDTFICCSGVMAPCCATMSR